MKEIVKKSYIYEKGDVLDITGITSTKHKSQIEAGGKAVVIDVWKDKHCLLAITSGGQKVILNQKDKDECEYLTHSEQMREFFTGEKNDTSD